MKLSDRQLEILVAIVEQYSEVAAPVGSVMLAKLFNVSSATIRLDMAKLENLGLIEQPHTSAGRIPTDRGYRAYVNYLNQKRQSEIHPVVVQHRANRALERKLSATSGKTSAMIRVAVRMLSELTDNLGFATIGDQIYTCGLTNLLDRPELDDRQSVLALSNLIDNLEPWLLEAKPVERVSVFIGSENPIGKASGATLVISRFRSPYSDKSYIGVLGPTRQSYAQVMQLVEQTGMTLEEVLSEA